MTDWIDFWDKENYISEKFWKKCNEVFFNNTLKLWEYDKNDIVLDIGCGKGYFAELIADKVKELHLIDTSSNCINICKEKFKHHKNVFTYLLPKKNYTDLEVLKNKFTKITCLSVIQYYKDFDEVKDLILQCKKISNNAKFLIADIPISLNPMFDVINLLYSSVRFGTLFMSLNYLFRMTFNEYSKKRRKLPKTIYSESQFINYLTEMKLNYTFYYKLTILSNRLNILIIFDDE